MRSQAKTRRPPKPAALFRKPLPEAKFRKSIAGLIELPEDRAFLEGCFELMDGAYSLKEGLERESLIRLNRLAKAIKANRGFIKAGPLVVVVLFAAALTVFGLFFMNPLIEKAAEGALQSLFEAKAEVSGLRLNLFGLRVSIGGIAVADRDAPMTNLFETGPLELRLDPYSALRGRIYIEEASLASLSVGGPRKSSGALPGAVPKEEAPEPRAEAGAPIVDFRNFDAKALLEREKSKLASVAAYERAGAAYDEASQRWEARAAASKKSMSDLELASKKVLAIDLKSIKTAPEALQAVAEAKALVDASKTVAAEAKAVAAGVKADSAAALALEKEARASIDKDFAYLKSFVDPKSGAAMEALDPVIRDLLSDKGERYYEYARRAFEVLLRLKARFGGGGDGGKERPRGLGAGRDVLFPSVSLPGFRLGFLGAAFPAGGSDWKFELREVSSDPALVAQPSSLAVDAGKGGQKVGMRAVADLRSADASRYSLDARAEGLALDLGDALAKAGVGSFAGLGSGSLELAGESGGALRAAGTLNVRDPVAGLTTGELGAAFASAIAETKLVRVDLGYEKPAGAEGRLSIKTNLDAMVASAMKALAARYADKAMAEVKAALSDYVGSELEGRLGSKPGLDGLLSGSMGDLKLADSLQSGLSGKIGALETKAKELAAGKAAEVGADLLKGAPIPSGTAIPAVPSMPTLPKLKP